MKIAFIAGGVFPTLSKTFIIDQIKELIERGHEVDIYARTPDTQTKVHPDVEKYKLWERTYYDWMPENDYLRLLKTPALLLSNFYKAPLVILRSLNVIKYGKKASSLRLLHQVIPHLGKQPYDIVHCHFGYNGLKSLDLRKLGVLKGKLIVTLHGVDLTKDLQQKGDRIYDQLFNQGDLFLPISEHWQSKLLDLGCDKRKIIVHRMGIDCQSFSFIPRQPRSDRSIRLLTISRLIEKKGVEYGIRAVAQLTKTNPNIEYKIIGDGPLKTELQQLIQELNVEAFVKLIGWQQKPKVIELLKNSDILLAPSITARNGDQEGIPVVLMEAMAMGLPVISTLHSGIPELVENGVSGFLVPERDVDGLAEKLNYLIQNPEMRTKMGSAGCKQVQEHYNLDKLNNRLVEIYQELCTNEQYC